MSTQVHGGAASVIGRVAGNNITVESTYVFKTYLDTVPGGRWDRAKGLWLFPRSSLTAGAIWDAARLSGSRIMADADFRELLGNYRAGDARGQLKVSTDLPAIPVTKTKPWGHQLQAYWFCRDLHGAYLDMFMGTGKSKVVIDLIQNRPEIRRVLITAPMEVLHDDVWGGQFEQHCAIPYRLITPQKGGIMRRVSEASEMLAISDRRGELAVIVVNHQAFWQRDFGDLFLHDAGLDMVIWDEVHRFKAPGGKQSRYAQRLARVVPWRLGLSGTRAPQQPADVYAQYRAIDEGVFGTSYTAFKARYCHMGGFEGREIVGYHDEADFRERADAVTFFAGDDVLDLPDTSHINRTYELGKEGRKLYQELEDRFYAEIKAGRITASNALVKTLRLRQVANGFVGTDPDEKMQRHTVRVDDGKAGLLQATLSDLPADEPVVIFCTYKDDLLRVHEVADALGRASAEMSGARKELAEWKADGGPPILAVQIQSGGMGIDLTKARVCIYYSLDFSLANYQQSQARIHRPGQTRPVLYVHLIASGTIDEDIQWGMEHKESVVERVLRGRSRRDKK